jgi:[ribosomal protein S5]-alanine N-acetyltransferase
MAADTPLLETPALVLCPFTPDQVDERYQRWLRDPRINRFLEARHSDTSIEALTDYVAQAAKNADRHFFRIIARDKERAIGTISLSLDRYNVAHFGYFIGDSDYWGGSFAMEAQVALFDFAFHGLNVRKVFGGVYAANTSSHFNHRRMGLKREAVLRSHVVDCETGPCDVIIYGILREEWTAGSRKLDKFRLSPYED